MGLGYSFDLEGQSTSTILTKLPRTTCRY
jgi:hypothetical protein